MQTHWQVSPDRGFLIEPDPLTSLNEFTGLAEIEGAATEMPELLRSGGIQPVLERLPIPDLLRDLNALDNRVIERLWVLYTYFANAYVFAVPDKPTHHIPASVAVPLHKLAEFVERPPIFSYVSLVLNNWQRLNPDGPIELGNIAPLQHFLDTPDEQWFGLVHVNVEVCAACAMKGIQDAINAADRDDGQAMECALKTITDGLDAMLKAFGRMTEGCDPDVYHRCVRPYMFGFENIVYEGVPEYAGKPQSFRGGSGAQSSTIPAIVGALGIQHEQSGLTQHLNIMNLHMPKAHREFITRVTTSVVRDYVKQSGNGALRDAYNRCLQEVMTFRRGHFHYARVYIFDKVQNPVGTGGTPFMDWLARLIAETEAHLL